MHAASLKCVAVSYQVAGAAELPGLLATLLISPAESQININLRRTTAIDSNGTANVHRSGTESHQTCMAPRDRPGFAPNAPQSTPKCKESAELKCESLPAVILTTTALPTCTDFAPIVISSVCRLQLHTNWCRKYYRRQSELRSQLAPNRTQFVTDPPMSWPSDR